MKETVLVVLVEPKNAMERNQTTTKSSKNDVECREEKYIKLKE